MPAPFKKCDVCGGKVPVQDPHSSCLLCLCKDHDAKACLLCKSLSAQARKNHESWLTSAIALGKVQEGGPCSSSVPPSAPPASSSRASVSSVTSVRASVSSVVSVPAGTVAPTTSDVARGSKLPSATNEPSKRPHKSSGTEGLEPKPKSGRKPDGSHARERTEAEVQLASPSSSKASRHASKPRELASPLGATSALPPDRARSPKPSSSGAAAVLLDLPENPFFPPEETPRSGKKRHHKEADRDPAPKKSKRSKEHTGTNLPSKAKDKKRSPSKKACAPAVLPGPGPAPEVQLVPVPDTPAQPTMDFVHEVEGATPSSLPGELPPLFPHSEDEEDGDEVCRHEAPDLFFDSETGRYFMSVPRDVAFKEFTRLNPCPADPLEGTSAQAIPSVSVMEKPPSSPRRRSHSSTGPIPVRPRSQVRVPDIPLTSDTDSEDEPLPPSDVPSDDDDLSASASPQRMHHPKPSSPSDDVCSFSEHIVNMARALDIELSFPEDDARDPVERRVHGRVPTSPCIPLLPSLETIVRRSWDSPTSLSGSSRKVESLYRVVPASCT
ncbi:vegetative cell wall protein gp1-like [Sceloporus undulatus]|uniref:vegetative cell wall protein gp1-like n=1 Tax=Sceloporus undulatus TaxID=8520 RepID=UPI001C4CD46A|nr:vegetative cell wall protein gp1-like [Sceloporus undulatus]XP_042328887.1 vegetative cell wall protein gp1-like [Sceloporus undulatus]XP_042328888.1 vegetative cell wall protein gp1-like [Sceloporus undulatus]XP_042328889.1 vegetative cell wall protein gp1-like [Sceloporus undulatus]